MWQILQFMSDESEALQGKGQAIGLAFERIHVQIPAIIPLDYQRASQA